MRLVARGRLFVWLRRLGNTRPLPGAPQRSLRARPFPSDVRPKGDRIRLRCHRTPDSRARDGSGGFACGAGRRGQARMSPASEHLCRHSWPPCAPNLKISNLTRPFPPFSDRRGWVGRSWTTTTSAAAMLPRRSAREEAEMLSTRAAARRWFHSKTLGLPRRRWQVVGLMRMTGMRGSKGQRQEEHHPEGTRKAGWKQRRRRTTRSLRNMSSGRRTWARQWSLHRRDPSARSR
mmetsp:Transcript_3126/g.7664  ORF Transcript_3126/g.7664 Transcript_3126/m.7664 type:complete len:233 (-) Transcript_3126:320-1018(-)